VTSRFRVANGKEHDVREAFANRPSSVDDAPGFLSMEVFSPAGDPSTFILVTRWTDQGSYESWHRSEVHAASKAGIPAGLKLDPSQTRIEVLELIEEGQAASDFRKIAADGVQTVARLLAACPGLVFIETDLQGRIRHCNPGAAQILGAADPMGSDLRPFLSAADVEWLERTLANDSRRGTRLLNLVDSSGSLCSVTAEFEMRPESIVICGALEPERLAYEGLMSLGGDLSVQLRDETQARTRLALALEELERSHWHIRRVQELLPVCMRCQRVKSEDSTWDSLLNFLARNSLLVTHGYCPSCAAALELEYGLSTP
jgi:heme-degrading monooxygenase HmoA